MKYTADQKMIDLLRNNPSEGMALLMDEYMGLLWDACRQYLHNTEDIRDCVQDTFVDFYEHLDRFDLEKGSIKAYLYVVAKRKAMRMLSKSQNHTGEWNDSIFLQEIDWTEEIINQTMLDKAISELKPEDGEIIRMKYYNGMTCAEIAREMQLPYETVKKRHQRNLKKLKYILIAMLLLGALTACAVSVIYHYRFSKSTGFQEGADDIWYEMTDAPMVLETKSGEVKIHNVLWKDGMVIIDLEFANPNLTDDEIEVKIYRKDSDETYLSKKGSILKGENSDTGELFPIEAKYHFFYAEPQEQYSFDILGEKYTVSMQTIGQFENLSDIGNHQTHNGRTIVLNEENTEDGYEIHAYVYSEDIWKITQLDGFRDYTWNRFELTDGYAFQYIGEMKPKPEYVEVDQLTLTSIGEEAMVHIPIPEESIEVDIPFEVGEDKYRISKIAVSRGTYQYGIPEEDEQRIRENGGELLIWLEPVQIEENTVLIGANVSFGEYDPDMQHYYSGKDIEQNLHFKEITNNMFAGYFLDDNMQPAEPIIRLQFEDLNELPEEGMLRIDQLMKFWYQNFQFELEQ